MDDTTSFYGRPGLNVETYDVRNETVGTSVAGDVEFYLDQARDSGGPVLELGAGTGRVAVPLAQAGFRVVALDASPAMRAELARRRAQLPPEVAARLQVVAGDMGDFDLRNHFRLVLVPFRAWQSLLDPAQQRRSLRCIHRHLEPGGRLVLDLFDPRLDWLARPRPPEEQATVRNPASGHVVHVRVTARQVDPLRQVLDETWRFTEVDDTGATLRQEDERLRLRWTWRWEARYLLELAGFEVEAEYSDFRWSPPAVGREQVWVARKPR